MEDRSFMDDPRVIGALKSLKTAMDAAAADDGMGMMKSLFVLGETTIGDQSIQIHVGCSCTACAMNAIAGIVDIAAGNADDPIGKLNAAMPRPKASH